MIQNCINIQRKKRNEEGISFQHKKKGYKSLNVNLGSADSVNVGFITLTLLHTLYHRHRTDYPPKHYNLIPQCRILQISNAF